MQFAPRIEPVFSLYVRMALGLGVVFEMPTLVMFLARVGLVTPRFLIRHTKYAILIIFIVAAIVTPGSDPLSLFLVAVPMIGLYAFSIIVAWVFKKRVRRRSKPDARRASSRSRVRWRHSCRAISQLATGKPSHRPYILTDRFDGLTSAYVAGTMRW